MTVESAAIVVILLIMAYMFVRSGRPAAAVVVLPLTVLPIFNLAAGPVARWLAPYIASMDVFDVRLIALILGLCLTCILLGFLGAKIHAKVARRAYLLLCGGYSLILACTMIFG